MSKVKIPFSIMCKPCCGTCNLDCDYCYYTMKPDQLYPGVKRLRMSEEVLETYTRQYLETQPAGCEFGWQGGEPTLMGLDFFRKAVELQNRYKKKTPQKVSNSLQTNGTLLTDQWCRFLADNGFLVGISLDGPPQWHDKCRKDHHGKPSFYKAWRGLELCRKHGVEFNVLVTLNSINAPHAGDIYRYFVNRGVRYLQFVPILERLEDGSPTPLSCSAEQFGNFVVEVFDLWRKRDIGTVSVRLIDSVINSILFGHATTCCYAERCANAFIVEWNGDVYACDHFVTEKWKLGNLMENHLSELVNSPLVEEFAFLKTVLPSVCRECEYLEFCHGGCPKHHVPVGTDPDGVNFYCSGLKRFFAVAIPELQRIAPRIRKGQVPSDIERVRQGDLPVEGDIGRNDLCPCGSGKKFKLCCGKNL